MALACVDGSADSPSQNSNHEEAYTMTDNDNDKSKYKVKIRVIRRGDERKATARMRWRHIELVGKGEAEVDPDDRYPAQVGEELAVARALTHLTRQLFAVTAGDVESVTGESVSVR
jgi:hypothetical protein